MGTGDPPPTGPRSPRGRLAPDTIPAVLDLTIDGVTVVDGTGLPAFVASVGIDDGKIAVIRRSNAGHVDDASSEAAGGRLDGRGLALTPGFVDVHNHSDLGPLVDPAMPSTIRQGVTTVVVGNCGASPFPSAEAATLASWAGGSPDTMDLVFGSFGRFLASVDAARPAVHIASLVGHGSTRRLAMGMERRPPSADELRAMRWTVAEAMDAGALGLSTGLIYTPGMYADLDELVAVAGEAARADGLYASHIRGEGAHLFRALDEAAEIGRRAEAPVHISHLKCESARVWGRAG